LSNVEFCEFWNGLEAADQSYWAEQFRLGPNALSKEFLAGFTSGDGESLDQELLKRLSERLRLLGTFSTVAQ
jgi:hypothetical protein